MFQEGKLKAGDKKVIKGFSEKYIVSEKLVANYIEHLTNIEMRKDEPLTDNEQEDLYHRNQLSSLRVGELKLHFNHHNIAFKGKKDATQVLQESYVPWHNIHVDM